jgi:V/A-type H+-transporting ATPase subunit E
LSKEESQSFMSSIFISNDLSGQIDVLIGELSQETITQEWLDQLANQNEMPVTYVLSSEVISNDGGFILSQDGIEYNYLYSSILDQISEEKEYDIVSELFKNEVI